MTRIGIVTGTSRGLGRAIAEHLLSEGWIVAGCSRTDDGPSHHGYRHYRLDVTDELAIVNMVRAVAAERGTIDALVNNAGIASMNSLLLTPTAVVENLMRVNYLGAFVFLRECAKIMVRRRMGRIVNLSTVAVPLSLEGEAAYVASKAALEALTRVASVELKPYGITVNAVGPGPVDTALTRTVPRNKIDALNRRIGKTEMGSATEVVESIMRFLNDQSGVHTGQVVYLGAV